MIDEVTGELIRRKGSVCLVDSLVDELALDAVNPGVVVGRSAHFKGAGAGVGDSCRVAEFAASPCRGVHRPTAEVTGQDLQIRQQRRRHRTIFQTFQTRFGIANNRSTGGFATEPRKRHVCPPRNAEGELNDCDRSDRNWARLRCQSIEIERNENGGCSVDARWGQLIDNLP